jgi:adenine-specific DNA-methyltransferase
MAHEKLRPQYFFDEAKIEQLKQIAPECFEDGKINFETLRENLGDWTQNEEDPELEHFGLFWPGKRDARKAAALPPEGTLEPVWGEGLKADGAPDNDGLNDSKNVFIEGENLEVLKLLQKSYAGKIKMIYIDPPYNTGNDFVYDDDFTEPLQEYLRRTGQVDEEGKSLTTNKRSDGRFHSKWLSMMYPRLRLARNLLRDDGVIFVSIDDNEVHNLRAIMNEIFGEENFITELVWKKRVSPANDSQWFSSDHEYIISYAKSKENWSPYRLDRTDKQNSYYKNPDNDPRGPWNSAAYTCNKNKDERPNLYYPITNPNTCEEIWPRETAVWAYSQETHQEHIKENLLYWGADGLSKSPRKKQYLTEAKKVVPRSFLDYAEVGSTQSATVDFLKIFDHNYFNYTKPVNLVKRLIKLSTTTNGNDIVLDFFAGSGTTGHATLETNTIDDGDRKFICVQLPELIDTNSQAYKDDYKKISDITKERLRRVFQLKENYNKIIVDKGFRSIELKKTNFNTWHNYSGHSIEQLQIDLENFNNSPLRDDFTKDGLLSEIMLLEGFTLCSTISILDSVKTNQIKKVSSEYCQHHLLVCLDDEIKKETISALELGDEDIFICLDSAISTEDKLRLSDKGLIKTI